MRNILLISLLAITFFSCKKETPSVEGNVSVYFTGQISDENYKFTVANRTNNAVWYMGYEENFPVYITSVLVNSKWEENGPGFCGTGLTVVMLNSRDSFSMDVPKPFDFDAWRFGVNIYFDHDENGQVVWSEAVN